MRALFKPQLSDRITPVYRKAQILKINDLYKLEVAKFMHQLSNKSPPISFEKYFVHAASIHRLTRLNYDENGTLQAEKENGK